MGEGWEEPGDSRVELGSAGLILLRPEVLFRHKGYGTWRGREELFASLQKERQTYVHRRVLEADSCHEVREKGFLLSLEKWGRRKIFRRGKRNAQRFKSNVGKDQTHPQFKLLSTLELLDQKQGLEVPYSTGSEGWVCAMSNSPPETRPKPSSPDWRCSQSCPQNRIISES